MWGVGANNGFAIGGSHFNASYGWGPIGPNGPDKGNWPGQLPQTYWSNGGGGGDMVSAITRCTQLIVNPIVDTQWRVRHESDPQAVDLEVPPWITAPMMAGKTFGKSQPIYPSGMRMNSRSFWSTALTHAIWWGRAAFVYQETEGDTPQPKAGTMLLLNPFLISQDGSGHWVLDAFGDESVRCDFDGGFEMGGKKWRLRVMRGMPPHSGGGSDDFLGGVLIRHAKTFGIATHLQCYTSNVFHSGIPTGVLSVSTPDITPQEVSDLRRAWEQAHGDRRGVAVLNSSVSYNPVMWDPVQTDATSIRRSTMQDIAWAFGLSSATALDIADNSMTYSNISSRNQQLLQETLRGWAAALLEVLTVILPAGQRIEVDWADYTAPTFQEMGPVIQSLVGAGLLTVNEGRERLGLGPMPEDDHHPEDDGDEGLGKPADMDGDEQPDTEVSDAGK